MISRRGVLLAVIAALNFGWRRPRDVEASTADHALQPGARQRLLAALGLRDVDLSVLRAHPHVCRQLTGALGAYDARWRQLSLAESARTLRYELARSIQQDFRKGAIVEVDGWQLASTEAMVLALLAQA